MGLFGFIKKAFKKVAPFAAFIPGVGPLASAALGAASTFIGGSARSSMSDPNQGPQPSGTLPTQTINGSTSSNFDWNALGAAGLSFAGGERANASNARSAQQQMSFQAAQSGTSYQRAVADMKAAGLSPMLAYSQGGASTPSGAMSSSQDTVTPAINTGRTAYVTKLNAQNLQLQNENLYSTNELISAQTDLTRASIPRTNASASQAIASTANIETQGKLLQQTLEQLSKTNPTLAKQLKANLTTTELAIPGLQNDAIFENATKGPAANTIRGLNSAGSVIDILKKLPGKIPRR